MSQPCDKNCNVAQPGELDSELNEFWEGSPYRIQQSENLSSFERNRVFLNVEGSNFVEVSHLSGADTDADGRGVIASDINDDGMPDLILRQAGGGAVRIYENMLPKRQWLKVSLRGVDSNRLGIGTRLVATVRDRTIVRELYPVNSYRSQNPSYVHLGLGDVDVVDRLVLRWPSGQVQEFHNIAAGRHVLIEEGNSNIEVVRRPAG